MKDNTHQLTRDIHTWLWCVSYKLSIFKYLGEHWLHNTSSQLYKSVGYLTIWPICDLLTSFPVNHRCPAFSRIGIREELYEITTADETGTIDRGICNPPLGMLINHYHINITPLILHWTCWYLISLHILVGWNISINYKYWHWQHQISPISATSHTREK